MSHKCMAHGDVYTWKILKDDTFIRHVLKIVSSASRWYSISSKVEGKQKLTWTLTYHFILFLTKNKIKHFMSLFSSKYDHIVYFFTNEENENRMK